MKKVLVGIVLNFIFVFSFIFSSFAFEIYPETMVVIELDYKANVVICATYGGEQIFDFKEIEDWAVGDIVAAIMDSNETEFQFDDVILEEKYCGFTNPETWLHPEQAP